MEESMGAMGHSFDQFSRSQLATIPFSLSGGEVKMEESGDQLLPFTYDPLATIGDVKMMRSHANLHHESNSYVKRADMIEGRDVYWCQSSTSASSSPSISSQEQQSATGSQVDIYRELILRHLIQDISSTCAKLSLPANPLLWDAEDCVKWIGEMCHQFQLLTPSKLQILEAMPTLQLGGKWMLSMGLEEFSRCVPDGGDTLHAQLQLWKTAFESAYSQQRDIAAQMKGAQMGGLEALGGREEPNCSGLAEDISSNASTSIGSTHQHDGGEFTDDDSSAAASTNNDEPLAAFFQFNSNSRNSSRNMTSQAFLEHGNNLATSTLHFGIGNRVHCSGGNDGSLSFNGGSGGQMSLSQPQHLYTDECESMGGNTHRTGQLSRSTTTSSNTIHLWHFIRELLDQPVAELVNEASLQSNITQLSFKEEYGTCVRWVDRQEGTFKIESSGRKPAKKRFRGFIRISSTTEYSGGWRELQSIAA